MHWAQILIIFFVSWWLVFLPCLSIGVQSQHESHEDNIAGTESGAPVAPNLAKKARWATAGALLITLIAAIFLPMLDPA